MGDHGDGSLGILYFQLLYDHENRPLVPPPSALWKNA